MLSTHNTMLEDQIAQQAAYSSTPPGGLQVSQSLILVSSVTVLFWEED